MSSSVNNQPSNNAFDSKKMWKWAAIGAAVLFGLHQLVVYQQMITLETTIPAKDKKAQNALATFTNNVPTQLGIAEQHVEATKEIVREWAHGKYGDGGPKTLFLAMHEAQIPVPSEQAFLRVMQSAEAGYKEFQVAQNDVVNDVAIYKRVLMPFYNVPAKNIGGFPQIKLEQYDRVILNDQAAQAYETGKFQGIDTSPKKEKPEKE